MSSPLINERLCRRLIDEFYRRIGKGEGKKVVLRELMQVMYAQGYQTAIQHQAKEREANHV